MTRRSFTRIHLSAAEHDANCSRALQVSPRKARFRVTVPALYPDTSPGALDVTAREGHYVDACCTTHAARSVGRRLERSEPLDVELHGPPGVGSDTEEERERNRREYLGNCACGVMATGFHAGVPYCNPCMVRVLR